MSIILCVHSHMNECFIVSVSTEFVKNKMQIISNVSSRNKLSFIFSASDKQTFIYVCRKGNYIPTNTAFFDVPSFI
jgi:hypothetical protein